MYITPFSKGWSDIPDAVYTNMKKKWDNDFNNEEGYANRAFTQGEITEKPIGK